MLEHPEDHKGAYHEKGGAENEVEPSLPHCSPTKERHGTAVGRKQARKKWRNVGFFLQEGLNMPSFLCIFFHPVEVSAYYVGRIPPPPSQAQGGKFHSPHFLALPIGCALYADGLYKSLAKFFMNSNLFQRLCPEKTRTNSTRWVVEKDGKIHSNPSSPRQRVIGWHVLQDKHRCKTHRINQT